MNNNEPSLWWRIQSKWLNFRWKLANIIDSPIDCRECGSCGHDGCCKGNNCKVVKCEYGDYYLSSVARTFKDLGKATDIAVIALIKLIDSGNIEAAKEVYNLWQEPAYFLIAGGMSEEYCRILTDDVSDHDIRDGKFIWELKKK